jgi:hypothetical protein
MSLTENDGADLLAEPLSAVLSAGARSGLTCSAPMRWLDDDLRCDQCPGHRFMITT